MYLISIPVKLRHYNSVYDYDEGISMKMVRITYKVEELSLHQKISHKGQLEDARYPYWYKDSGLLAYMAEHPEYTSPDYLDCWVSVLEKDMYPSQGTLEEVLEVNDLQYNVVGYGYNSCGYNRDIAVSIGGRVIIASEQWFWQVVEYMEEEDENALFRYSLENQEIEERLLAS